MTIRWRRLTYGGNEAIVSGTAVVSAAGYHGGFEDVIRAGLGIDQPGWNQEDQQENDDGSFFHELPPAFTVEVALLDSKHLCRGSVPYWEE